MTLKDEAIFDDYGIKIAKRSAKYYISYDEGELMVKFVEKEITERDALKAQKSSQDAYEVIIAIQNAENPRLNKLS